jgi:hypothetical protein
VIFGVIAAYPQRLDMASYRTKPGSAMPINTRHRNEIRKGIAPGLFTEVAVPRRHLCNELARQATWLTWSEEFLNFWKGELGFLSKLPMPRVTNVRGCSPYAASFYFPPQRMPPHLRKQLLGFGRTLVDCEPGLDLWLFAGMLVQPIDSLSLHKFFALLRSAVVLLRGATSAALHSPVVTARRDTGFALHADLFVRRRLWLIFDQVPHDQSGASIFLKTERALQLISTVNGMPRSTKLELKSLLTGKIRRDSFDRCYDLLHLHEQPWSATFQTSLDRNAERIKLFRGEGYMVNDRGWLHGREPSSKPVTKRRFHRFVF